MSLLRFPLRVARTPVLAKVECRPAARPVRRSPGPSHARPSSVSPFGLAALAPSGLPALPVKSCYPDQFRPVEAVSTPTSRPEFPPPTTIFYQRKTRTGRKTANGRLWKALTLRQGEYCRSYQPGISSSSTASSPTLHADREENGQWPKLLKRSFLAIGSDKANNQARVASQEHAHHPGRDVTGR